MALWLAVRHTFEALLSLNERSSVRLNPVSLPDLLDGEVAQTCSPREYARARMDPGTSRGA